MAYVLVPPGASANALAGEFAHAQPRDRVHIDDFSNHGFNGVLAATYTADGRFGGHLALDRLAVVPTDTDQIRAHAARRDPSLTDGAGTPLIDVAILRRETGPAVAITPGVALGEGFVPAGYSYVEPVPGDHSAVHLVAYAREVAERYLPHSPVPLRFRTVWRQATLEPAREAMGRRKTTHIRAGNLTSAPGSPTRGAAATIRTTTPTRPSSPPHDPDTPHTSAAAENSAPRQRH